MNDVGDDKARARNIRVAFLVDLQTCDHNILDGISAKAMGWYGGRFSLIVPCLNGRPSEQYELWLRAFDPDIVYVYFTITDGLASWVHQTFYPSALIEHPCRTTADGLHKYSKPDISFELLTALSFLPLAANSDPFSEAKSIRLLDEWWGANSDPFVVRNFGSYPSAYSRWPLPPHLSNIAQPLYFVPEAFNFSKHSKPGQNDEVVRQLPQLLERLRGRGVVTLSQLSARDAPRLEFYGDTWDRNFQLFVGDTVEDRIAFWNARSFAPYYHDGDHVGLHVSPQFLKDGALVKALVDFIRANNRFSSGNGQGGVAVVSLSLDPADLEQTVALLKAQDPWQSFGPLKVNSLVDICPEEKQLREYRITSGYGRGLLQREREWVPMDRRAGLIRSRPTEPWHLSLILPQHRSVSSGSWALDCSITRSNNLSRFTNVRDRWTLPRTPRMIDAFRAEVSDEHRRSIDLPLRRSRGGLVTGCADRDGAYFVLKEPDDDQAFEYGLMVGFQHCWTRRKEPDFHLPPLAFEARSSDKRRYLTGVIQIFGGFEPAIAYLTNQFWVGVFGDLGGSRKTHDQQVQTIEAKLAKYAAKVNLESEDSRKWLAAFALEEAVKSRTRPAYVTLDQLQKRYAPICQEYWQALTHEPHETRAEFDAASVGYLRQSIQYLVHCQVLHQGLEWPCRKCQNRNWVALDRLTSTLSCLVCGAREMPPIDEPWMFRLNSFVAEALREHGVGATIWCLHALQDDDRLASFFYLGPTDIMFEGSGRSNAFHKDQEIDLLVASSGKLKLVEVKSSDQNIGDFELQRLANFARKLAPDEVIVAVHGASSPRGQSALVSLRNALDGTGIGARLITRTDTGMPDYLLPSYEID